MAIKKGNQKQKQKQKQKQTDIVNINEKPKQTRRRKRGTAPSKPSQPSNMHMFNPSIINTINNKPSQTNDDVKDAAPVLFLMMSAFLNRLLMFYLLLYLLIINVVFAI